MKRYDICEEINKELEHQLVLLADHVWSDNEYCTWNAFLLLCSGVRKVYRLFFAVRGLFVSLFFMLLLLLLLLCSSPCGHRCDHMPSQSAIGGGGCGLE